MKMLSMRMMISIKIRTNDVANAIGANVGIVMYILLGCMQRTFSGSENFRFGQGINKLVRNASFS